MRTLRSPWRCDREQHAAPVSTPKQSAGQRSVRYSRTHFRGCCHHLLGIDAMPIRAALDRVRHQRERLRWRSNGKGVSRVRSLRERAACSLGREAHRTDEPKQRRLPCCLRSERAKDGVDEGQLCQWVIERGEGRHLRVGFEHSRVLRLRRFARGLAAGYARPPCFGEGRR